MIQLFKIAAVVLLLSGSIGARAQAPEKWSLEKMRLVIETAEQPLVLNFWATFCKPCLAEMPHFQKMAGKYEAEGLKMIFVSVDLPEAYPDRINTWIKRLKISAPVSFLNETNADEFCPVVDPSWTGAIPATLLINNKTGYRRFFEEEISEKKLEQLILELLSNEAASD